MYNSRTIAIAIQRPADEVFHFVLDPLNFMKWAFVGQSTMRHLRATDWEVETSVGRRILRLGKSNPNMILDHYSLRSEGDEPLPIPMRVVPNQEGSILIHTFFQRPELSDAEWESLIEWVTTDLMTLKTLLESRSDVGSGGAGAVLPDEGDAQHVGGTGRAEWDAGGDGDAVTGTGITFLVSDDAGAVDEILVIDSVIGEEALDAPDHRQAAGGSDVGGEGEDGLGRPFARRTNARRA